MTQIDALQADIAALTKSLYQAYNKINQLQDKLNEEIKASKKTTAQESQEEDKVT